MNFSRTFTCLQQVTVTPRFTYALPLAFPLDTSRVLTLWVWVPPLWGMAVCLHMPAATNCTPFWVISITYALPGSRSSLWTVG
jgi:hypothetical protein